jgi:hypothetical protein
MYLTRTTVSATAALAPVIVWATYSGGYCK